MIQDHIDPAVTELHDEEENMLARQVHLRYHIRCQARSAKDCLKESHLDAREFDGKDAASNRFQQDGWTLKDELSACPKCSGE